MQTSKQAGKHLIGAIQSEPCPEGACLDTKLEPRIDENSGVTGNPPYGQLNFCRCFPAGGF